ncbi:DUF4442 domain-containing protein [Agaribacter marinus]|uniref:DUF4442 domain-containing protein n=1 Tax=Agaribacter marinus TaxID=1431249 RepID=A0AA37T297_9ALTE|nr:DUF4442 domain-containing protein [Agaribacter marinus]GLR72630.1 DUF4442 domain-containing protein [Agaribacter marinus]
MLSWLSLREAKRFVKQHQKGKETFKTRCIRRAFNFIPNHYFSGGRVIYLSPCMTKGIVTLPYCYRTINVFGNFFGGSMFAGTDPMGMALTFLNINWKKYVPIDKTTTIKYIRPGKRRLYAILELFDEEKETMNQSLELTGHYLYTCSIDIVDANMKKYAQVDKVVHIECKQRLKNRIRK